MKTVVAVPTYNELESLPTLVQRLRAAVPDADIVIVDDNSPDGTGDLADEMAAADDHIKVLHRQAKNGLGPAYIEAFKWATAAGYEVVCECDADGSHRPEQLPRLLKAVAEGGADLAIGSRWIRGGAVNGWAWQRELLSRAGNAYIGAVLGLHVADATAGFRAYRTDLFERLNLDEVEATGFGFQIDMTRRARKVDARIIEVPITFDERMAGTSKMSGSIITEALLRVTKWGIDDAVEWVRTRLG